MTRVECIDNDGVTCDMEEVWCTNDYQRTDGTMPSFVEIAGLKNSELLEKAKKAGLNVTSISSKLISKRRYKRKLAKELNRRGSILGV